MMKKLTAIVLSVLMLLTMLPMGGLAVAADEVEYPYLELGVSTNAVVEDEFTCFSFIPSVNGYYAFYSTAYEDTHGYLYDADGNELAYDDQSGGNNDFRIVRRLIEGETYLLKTGYYSGESGSFPVCVEMIENPRVITNVEFRDVVMLAESAAEGADIHAMIYYSDGTVEEGTSRWLRDELGRYEVEREEEIPHYMWEVGGTYTVMAEVVLSDRTITGSYTVTVTDTPIASVEIAPVTVIENYNCYVQTDYVWDEEKGEEVCVEYVYYYDIAPQAEDVTITLKDGTVIHDNCFEWGVYKQYIHVDEQYYNNHLQKGINERTFSIAGYEGTYIVEVVETPVASVELPQLWVMQGADGYWETNVWDENRQEYVEGKRFYYYWNYVNPEEDQIVITLKDGTVIRNNYFEWGGKEFSLHTGYNSNTELNLGINEFPYSIAGYEGTYTIEVIESPVASVEVAPTTAIQNSNGYWATDWVWDSDLQCDVEVKYFRYYACDPDKDDVLITLKDGTVIRDNRLEVNGREYYFKTDSQRDNPLQIGVNERSFLFAGCEGTFTVTLIETPVVSVEIPTIYLVENRNGYWSTISSWIDDQYTEVQFFEYHNAQPDYRDVVITLKDGTVIHGDYFTLDGETYYLDIEEQWRNPLLPGTNQRKFSIAGYEGTFTTEVQIVSVNDTFEYMYSSNGMIITDYFGNENTLTIPSTIEGKPVVGVVDLDGCVEHLILPDSVETVGEYVLQGLTTVSFGAGVKNLDTEMFDWCYGLESITVSPANPYFTIIDGALYDKAGTTFLAYPMGSGDLTHTVPATATDLENIFRSIYSPLSITVAAGNPNIVTKDGVTYDKNMTRILFCDQNKAGAYVMPDTVTEIAACAFIGCRQLTSVTVAPSVTTIVYYSFADCTGLTSVTLPEGLVSIGQAAFANTAQLTSIDLPETLTYIGETAFANSGLTSLTLPDSVKQVDGGAFYGTALRTVDMGKVEYLGGGVFAATPLQTVVIPDSVTYVGSSLFEDCGQLRSITFGKGVDGVSYRMLANTGLQSIVIPAHISDIGVEAFAGCDQLESVTLHSGVSIIYDGAFSYCGALDAITIPEGVECIGEYAFASTGLKEIVIPDSVIFLGAGCFSDCTSLTRAVVGEGVTFIYACLFLNCPLESIDWHGDITAIAGSAFGGTNLTSIVIPESVTTICYYAFEDSTLLAHIDVPEGLISIGHNAFDNTAWHNAQPDGVTYLEHIAYDYKGLMPANTALTIPEGITVIAEGAFGVETNLTAITLPVSLKHVNGAAFSDCTALTDVYYAGTREQMEAIEFGEYNEYLLEATWHYAAHVHVYDDACDADCNECGETREAPHAFVDPYDADCDLCGLTREVAEFQYGDGNGDGKVNIRDLGVLQQKLNGWDVSISMDAMDITGDGKVNIRDLGLLQQFLNGWDVKLGKK